MTEQRLNDLMESKGGKKKSSSKSLFYEAPLGYSIEDIRPNGGIKKFRSAAYSNVSLSCAFLAFFCGTFDYHICFDLFFSCHMQCARKPS